MKLLKHMQMFVEHDIQQRLVLEARKIAQQNCGELLYLTAFGSHLYGTVTEHTTDIDLKGIFLPFVAKPTEEVMLRGKINDSEKGMYTSSWERTTDHTKVRYEIELWSLQLWLNHFLKNGDTGAVDTFYAFFQGKNNSAELNTYDKKDIVLYIHPCMDKLFQNSEKLFNPLNTRAFLGYVIGQAQRYGVKGIRLQVLLDILKHFGIEYKSDKNGALVLSDSIHDIFSTYEDIRLEDHIDVILEKCYHDLYCHLILEDGKPKFHAGMRVLRVNGKLHQGSIFVSEFLNRISTGVEEYGHRAIKAAESKGKDWKALSHAYRVILELEELLTIGRILFPLKEYKIVRTIKLGEISLEDVQKLISDGLLRVDNLRKITTVSGAYDKDYVDQFIVSCYNTLDTFSG